MPALKVVTIIVLGILALDVGLLLALGVRACWRARRQRLRVPLSAERLTMFADDDRRERIKRGD